MTRPWSSTTISSTWRSVDSRWAMINVVRPAVSRATAASSGSSVAGSTRAVASSSTTMSGSRSHTRASARSCASPADRPAPPAPSCRWMPPSAKRAEAGVAQRRRDRVVGRRLVEQGDVVADRAARAARPPGGPAQLAGVAHRAGSRSMGTPPSSTRAAGASTSRNTQPRQRGLAAAGATDHARSSGPRRKSGRSTAARAGRRRSRSRRRRNSTLSGPRGGERRAVVADVGLDRQQVDDPHHRAIGLLHGLELIDHVLQRSGQQQDVLEQQEASPTVMMWRLTSRALAISDTTEPAATAPSTPHHMRRNAFSRRTALPNASALSSTNRHMAWAPAPLERRSSAAVRRSSIPPYRRAYEPISSDDSPTARCRPRTTTATAATT